MTHKIRTTMQPDVDLEVDDTEYLDLKRQGLLAYDDAEETTQAEKTDQPVTAGSEAAAQQREQGPAANPATPDQAQAPAPATTKPARPAINKEG